MLTNHSNILCGPIVRYTSLNEVNVWIACAKRPNLKLVLDLPPTDPEQDRLQLESSQKSLRISPHFHVSLLQVKVVGAHVFPTNAKIYYGLEALQNSEVSQRDIDRRLAEVARVPARKPYFILPFQGSSDVVRIYFASCRKLGSNRPDKIVDLGKKLTREEESIPKLMILGGDQIYADDESRQVYNEIERVAGKLFPDLGWKKKRIPYERLKRSGLTSGNLDYHLSTLEEWCALYVIAWSGSLESNALPAEERFFWQHTLAHVPSYMQFDDHDVSDDWNMDDDWEASSKQCHDRFLFVPGMGQSAV